MTECVLSLEVALAEVAKHARLLTAPVVSETVELREAGGRILAEAVFATRDQPAFDRSTRDGFAVRSADLGAPLRIVGTVRAGERFGGAALEQGEAVEIMTGAPLPPGADCVLMVEHAAVEEAVLKTSRRLHPGDNVVARGAEARAGGRLLAAGQLIDGAAIAVAAGCGNLSLRVYEKPTVAVLATGDELVEVDACTLEPWQIYNSNTHALAALVEEAGGVAVRLPILRDRRGGEDGLDAGLARAGTSDLLLLSGGVSMGKYDLVEQTLADNGAEFFFTGAKIQPGKPIVFGRLPKRGRGEVAGGEVPAGGWTYFFGLPGNPVSTEVCFHLFAAMMVRALAGGTEIASQFVAAVAAEPFEGKLGLTRLLPARLESSLREVNVRPVAWQGSGDTAANARANCYCVVEERGVGTGDVVRVLLR